MSEVRVCAMCALSFLNAASMILYQPPGPVDAVVLSGRGAAGVNEVRRILEGEHPQVEPGGRLMIDGQWVEFEPVTQIGGTLTCPGHMYDLWNRLDRMPRGRPW